MSSDSDDDESLAKLGAASAAADGASSDSMPEWVKTFKFSEGDSAADSTSASDSDGPTDTDDENKPLASFMQPANSESGLSSDTGSEAPKAKRKRVTGVPSVVPLCLPGKGKLKMTNLLLQLEDEDLDLSGDTGAVGRFSASKKKVELDLKGVTYAGSVLKCHTLCTVVVNQHDGKAEIKEVFGNFVHLSQTADVRDKEVMAGGSFDDFEDFGISGDESVDENSRAKGGRKKGANGRKPAPKKASSATAKVAFTSFNHHTTHLSC